VAAYAAGETGFHAIAQAKLSPHNRTTLLAGR
jgi:hypothetical protein